MKKYLYIALAVLLVGGIVFAGTQGRWLQGLFSTLPPDYTSGTTPTVVLKSSSAEDAREYALLARDLAESHALVAEQAVEDALDAYNNNDASGLESAKNQAMDRATEAENQAKEAQSYADQAKEHLLAAQADFDEAQALADELSQTAVEYNTENLDAQERVQEAQEEYDDAFEAYEWCSSNTTCSNTLLGAYRDTLDEAGATLETAEAYALSWQTAWEEAVDEYAAYYSTTYKAAKDARDQAEGYADEAQQYADEAAQFAEAAADAKSIAAGFNFLTCESLSISPSAYTMESTDSVASFSLSATVSAEAETTARHWAAESLQAFSADFDLGTMGPGPFSPGTEIEPESKWVATLVFEASTGTASFTEGANTGNPLELSIESAGTKTVSFTGGVAGTVVKVYVKEEEANCSQSFTITQKSSGTTTTSTDSDGDGLTDEEEANLGTDPKDADSDNDGLSDGEEVDDYDTDPLDADSDNDGLTDGEEVEDHDTDPKDADSDNDGLSDGEEVDDYDTDPLDADSDNDGVKDGEEVDNETDPLDPEDSTSADLNLGALESAEDCEESYRDVEDDEWFAETVCRLTEAGVVEGRTQYSSYSLFYPSDEITKAETLKLISLLLLDLDESDARGRTTNFTDLATTDWYYPWVVNTEREDVLRTRDWGNKGNFNENITRGELVVYIARALGLSSYSYEVDYTDVDEDDWFAYAIALLSRTESDYVKDMPYDGTDEELPVLEGYQDGSFRPYGDINRAEALTMIYRAYHIYLVD